MTAASVVTCTTELANRVLPRVIQDGQAPHLELNCGVLLGYCVVHSGIGQAQQFIHQTVKVCVHVLGLIWTRTNTDQKQGLELVLDILGQVEKGWCDWPHGVRHSIPAKWIHTIGTQSEGQTSPSPSNEPVFENSSSHIGESCRLPSMSLPCRSSQLAGCWRSEVCIGSSLLSSLEDFPFPELLVVLVNFSLCVL